MSAGAERGARARLDELPLASVRAHDGEGLIGFHRVFTTEDLRSACDFADYAVLPPGTSIGVHRHGANEEIYLVLDGEGTMTLDGETFRVGKGDVVLNRSGGEHGLRNDGTAPLRLFVVQVALPAGRAEGRTP